MRTVLARVSVLAFAVLAGCGVGDPAVPDTVGHDSPAGLDSETTYVSAGRQISISSATTVCW